MWDFKVDWKFTEQDDEPQTTQFGLRSSRRDMGFTALGVYSVRNTSCESFYEWKKSPMASVTVVMAAELSTLIANWFPVRGVDWVITTPPQGASKYKTENGAYPAEKLGREVAAALGLDYLSTLARQTDKKRHGKREAMAQDDFVVTTAPRCMAIVIDDMLTSGTTMGLSVKALRAVGVPTMQFVWIGV